MPLVGRRIVDINFLFEQIKSCRHVGGFGCNFLDMEYISEIRYGFMSKFKFECKMCGIKTIILSTDPTLSECLPINDAVVNGTVSIGKIID